MVLRCFDFDLMFRFDFDLVSFVVSTSFVFRLMFFSFLHMFQAPFPLSPLTFSQFSSRYMRFRLFVPTIVLSTDSEYMGESECPRLP